MNTFIYSYPIKTFFGEGAARDNLPDLLAKYVTNVLLEYGRGCQPTEFILIGAMSRHLARVPNRITVRSSQTPTKC